MNPFLLFGLGYMVWRWLSSETASAEASAAAASPSLPIPPASVAPQGAVVLPNVGPSQPSGQPSGQAGSSTVPPTKPAPYQIKDRQRLDAGHVLAKDLARELQGKGRNVNRELLRRFQRVAGLSVDGVYGPKTAGALRWFTVEPPTRPNGIEIAPHVGTGFAPYAPAF